jgi:hypothetical protein
VIRPAYPLIWALLLWMVGSGKVLSVEAIVTNIDGRSFQGEITLTPENTLELGVQADAGYVAYTFTKQTIAGLELLDAENLEDGLEAYENEHFQVAAEYLEPIHRSRSPLLKVYPEAQLIEPSLILAETYLKVRRFADTAGIAGNLLATEFQETRIHKTANELLLKAYFGMERWDESELLAKRWCEVNDPSGESALGWWILSAVHLERGELEKARWVSLQPITFSSQYPKAYLQESYHMAIAAWIDESPKQALRLYQEYEVRGYDWPSGYSEELLARLISLTVQVEESEQNEDANALTIESGAPKKDLNLPLEKVRKLTTKQEPESTP